MKVNFLQLKGFRFKIFMLFFIFTVMISTFLGLLLYNTSAEKLKQQMCDTMYNNLKNASYNFDSLLDSINNISTQISLDPLIMESLQRYPGMRSYDYLKMNLEIRKQLEQARYSNSHIKSLYVLSPDFNYFNRTQIDRTYTASELLSTDWAGILPGSRDYHWYILNGENLTERNPEFTITTVKTVKNSSMTKKLGYVVANIGFGDIRNFFKDISFGTTGYVVVYNSDKKLVFHPDASLNGKTEKEVLPDIDTSVSQKTIFKRDTMITYVISPDSGFIYAAYIPMREVIGPIKVIRNETAILLAFCLIVALVYAVIISNQIFSPIKILVEHMKKAGNGETNIRISEVRKDEMGILYTNFNKMIEQIKNLINKLYMQEMISKELQLKSLQIQLNPHFLYNTLDAIHWSARENDMDDVCKMTFLLSKFFRKNLNDGRDFITVGEAAEIARSYIELQKVRYLDKIDYAIEIDEEVRQVMVLKYIFQPLIENAILHGLEKSSGTGMCRVSWKLADNCVRFSVEDNGAGIPEEKLAEICAALNDDTIDSSGNFALKNINHQLKLYYGEKFPLTIKSVYGEGTLVSLQIPIVTTDAYSKIKTRNLNP